MARAPYRGGAREAVDESPALPVLDEGELVVVPTGTTFPRVCVKCGSKNDLLERVNRFAFAEKPSMGKRVLWGALLGPVGGAIAQAQATTYATFTLPLCPRCDARWTDAKIASIASLLPLVGVAIWLFSLMVNQAPGGEAVVPGIAFLATIAIVAVVNRIFVPPRTIRCLAIQGRYVKLSGVGPAARAALLGLSSEKKKKKRKSG